MKNETQNGYLILADISGYTSYLAGSELDHARDVLTELMELIVGRFKQVLTISKLEGDAVFAYVPESGIIRDEMLLELLESTYFDFRSLVEGIHRKTTCECNACKLIPSLDLKFIIHYGDYAVQDISGTAELVGSDVNLVHRLLKNQVSEATGWNAYLLITEAGLNSMNLVLENLHEEVESYESLGDVTTFSLGLHERYKAMLESRRFLITEEMADATITRSIPAPLPVVWDWLNDINKRIQWEGHENILPIKRLGGRVGAGSQNHCAHGKDMLLETIVDWRPFDYFTYEHKMDNISYQLFPHDGGTKLVSTYKLKLPFPRWLNQWFGKIIIKQFGIEKNFDRLITMVAEEKDL